MSWFSRSGDDVLSPPPFAGLRIVRIQETTNTELAAGNSRDHHVLDDQRGAADAVTLLGIGNSLRPADIAALGIERHQFRIERPHVERLAENGDTPVDLSTTDGQLRGKTMFIFPVAEPGPGVHGPDLVLRECQEHHAINDQRCGFKRRPHRELTDPLDLELVRVAVIDLVQLAKPLSVVLPRIGQPVPRIFRGSQDLFVSDTGMLCFTSLGDLGLRFLAENFHRHQEDAEERTDSKKLSHLDRLFRSEKI